MHLDSWKSSLDLLARWHPCLRKQEDLDWVLEALRLRRCRRRFWPPRSPNCNSFRYFVWGESEVWVIEKSRSKTKNLIQKMKEVLGSFNRDTVVKACMNLRPRIYAVVNADGSFNKENDSRYVPMQIWFYFNQIGWLSTVLCHLKVRRKKFRIYRCHPVFSLKCWIRIWNQWIRIRNTNF